MKPVLFIKETLADAIKVLTSREGLKNLYGVSLYRNAVYLMLSSIVLGLTGFFFWVVAARLYPVEGVGLASAAISAMGLLALLSTLGLDYGLIRFLPQAGGGSRDMMNTCFTIGAITAIALSLIFLAGLPLWSPALLSIRAHPAFIAAFVMFTVAITLQSFTRQTFIAERRTEFAVWQGLIFGLLRFVPLVALAALFHTFGIFASWGIAASIAVAISISLLIPRVEARYLPFPVVKKEIVKDIAHFSGANYIATLIGGMPHFILPLMVINLLGAEQSAYFYIGYAIANILLTIPMATSFSLFAEGSYDEENLARDVRRSLKLVLLILIPAIVIVFLLGDKILLLFGEAYSENATRLLWCLALSALPAGINTIYFGKKRVEKRMRSVMVLSALVTAAILGLSYFLLPRMGIIGAGIACLIGRGLVSLGTTGALLRRHQGA